MLSDGTFDFNLRKPIEVAGVDAPVEILTFHECGEGYDSYYMKLRKFILNGQMNTPELMKKLSTFIKEDDDSAIASGTEVKPLHEKNDDDHLSDTEGFAEVLKIALGTSDDLEHLVKNFGFMVSSKGGNPICTVDGIRVKEGAWVRLHPEDKINVAVQYCVFFGIGLDKVLNNEPETVSDSPMEVKAL